MKGIYSCGTDLHSDKSLSRKLQNEKYNKHYYEWERV